MKILIVEDDKMVAMLAQEGLTLSGHDARVVVHNTEDAMRAASLFAIDLAFVDIGLNGDADGVSLAELLQVQYKIPCIFVSGRGDIARANRHAAKAYLPKPYKLTDLDKSAKLVKAIDSGEQLKPSSITFPLELF